MCPGGRMVCKDNYESCKPFLLILSLRLSDYGRRTRLTKPCCFSPAAPWRSGSKGRRSPVRPRHIHGPGQSLLTCGWPLQCWSRHGRGRGRHGHSEGEEVAREVARTISPEGAGRDHPISPGSPEGDTECVAPKWTTHGVFEAKIRCCGGKYVKN